MCLRRVLFLTSAVVLACAAPAERARAAPPEGSGGAPVGTVRDADVAIGYDAKGRCPELMHADAEDRTGALVLFLVGPTGVPSRASVRSSSGSESLDAAAVSCVQRLRFLPAVHAGDGNAIDSWQQIAWRWGRSHTETPAPAAAATGAIVSAPMSMTAATTGSSAAATGAAEARVCLNASGALAQEPVITRSSGDAGLDAAALAAARAAAPSSAARAACLRITLAPERATRDGAR